MEAEPAWTRQDALEFTYTLVDTSKGLTVCQDKNFCTGARAMPSHGHCVWDAALLLSQFFQVSTRFPPNFFESKKVIELGAGVGLVGMTLATLGAHVVLSDQDYCVPLLKENVRLNQSHFSNPIAVKTLQWGSNIETLPIESPDLIVASDIIYNESSFELLIQTLKQLWSSATQFYLCFETRNLTKEKLFLDLLVTHEFIVEQIPDEECQTTAASFVSMRLEYPSELAIYKCIRQ